MEIEWEFESELALRAVSSACEDIFDNADDVVVRTKESPRSLVTNVDVEIEKRISAILQPSGYPIIAEESFKEGSLVNLPAGAFWMVDPLDGTVNFVNGIPFYGVSVGLGRGEDFLTGAVAVPPTRELFFTQGNHRAYLNGKTLSVQDCRLDSALLAVAIPNRTTDAAVRSLQYEVFGQVNEMSGRGCLRTGSAALNLCYVAAGRFQATYGLNLNLWDVAAGFAIARRSGCSVIWHREPKSQKISYIVGAPTVAFELKEILVKSGLFPSTLNSLS